MFLTYWKSKTRRSDPTATATDFWVGWTAKRAGATSISLLVSPSSIRVSSIFLLLLREERQLGFFFLSFSFRVSDPTKSVLMGLAHLGFIYEAQWAYDKWRNNTRLQAHFLWSPTRKWQENKLHITSIRHVSIVKIG